MSPIGKVPASFLPSNSSLELARYLLSFYSTSHHNRPYHHQPATESNIAPKSPSHYRHHDYSMEENNLLVHGLISSHRNTSSFPLVGKHVTSESGENSLFLANNYTPLIFLLCALQVVVVLIVVNNASKKRHSLTEDCRLNRCTRRKESLLELPNSPTNYFTCTHERKHFPDHSRIEDLQNLQNEEEDYEESNEEDVDEESGEGLKRKYVLEIHRSIHAKHEGGDTYATFV